MATINGKNDAVERDEESPFYDMNNAELFNGDIEDSHFYLAEEPTAVLANGKQEDTMSVIKFDRQRKGYTRATPDNKQKEKLIKFDAAIQIATAAYRHGYEHATAYIMGLLENLNLLDDIYDAAVDVINPIIEQNAVFLEADFVRKHAAEVLDDLGYKCDDSKVR